MRIILIGASVISPVMLWLASLGLLTNSTEMWGSRGTLERDYLSLRSFILNRLSGEIALVFRVREWAKGLCATRGFTGNLRNREALKPTASRE